MKKVLGVILFLVLFCTGCGTIDEQTGNNAMDESWISKAAATTDQTANPKLTSAFLEGVWVNETGFVCEYTDTTFIDSESYAYEQCKITDAGIEGVNI